jgi:hypothetical protein
MNFLNKNDALEIMALAEKYRNGEHNIFLKERIELLSKDALCELIALVWTGRECIDSLNVDNIDYQENFNINLSLAKSNPPDADYLVGKNPLADYIKKGLEVLK